MLTFLAFLVALGLLIAVHEYGHYRTAVACGVKVLRFGIATLPMEAPDGSHSGWLYRLFYLLTRPVLEWTLQSGAGKGTVFALGLFPVAGYVKMLDEREAPVASHERHLAFNTRPVSARAAIVAAGPAANLALAVLLYALVHWIGVDEPRALLAVPVAGSLAEKAGLAGGEEVISVRVDGQESQAVRSFDGLRWTLAQAALDGQNVELAVVDGTGQASRRVSLALASAGQGEADAAMFRRIGLLSPLTRPVIGPVTPSSAAERAGLRSGDLVTAVGQTPVRDGSQLREMIRHSLHDGRAVTATWSIERDGQVRSLEVKPEAQLDGAEWVGRIGAYVGDRPAMVRVQYGALNGLELGVRKTWDVASLTLRMMGRMLVGQASLKNLSGPLTIADYAGKSAHQGLTPYLVFLALISVSLGVLNLLPLPVLDGGHLMYYLWESVVGSEVSQARMEVMQRFGVGVLLLMMFIALFNDLNRLFG